MFIEGRHVEGDTELENGNARTALVAEAFVAERLRDETARGITSGETPCDENFDALARYANADPSAWAGRATTADD